MPDQNTDKHYLPPLLGVASLALQIAKSKLGEHEAGHNQGEIVRWACQRWLSDHRFDEMYGAGKLEWCAGFVSSCVDEAINRQAQQVERAGDDRYPRLLVAASDWRHHVASLSASDLYARCEAKGWLVDDAQPGDIQFFHKADESGADHVYHVGIVESVDPAADARWILSGNAWDSATQAADIVSRAAHRHDDPHLFRCARVPW